MARFDDRLRLRKLSMLSLFSAIAYLSIYVVNFKVAFLTFDIKNVFITIAAMLYGPIEGAVVSLVAGLLEFILFSSETGLYGLLMNVLSSASFAVIAALLYQMKRTPVGSYISLASATVGSTAVMLFANLFITPFFLGGTVKEVVILIPKLLFPFNLIKCLVNAAVVLILYKPISLALRRAGMIKKESSIGEGTEASLASATNTYFSRRTLITVGIAFLIVAASLTVFFLILGGEITWGV